MAAVTIRSRRNGIVELAPEHAPTDAFARFVVLGTVLLVVGGLFVSGLMPAGVLAAMALSCLAGEAVLALEAILLRVLRPAAEVLELGRCRPQRR
jgi:hypothetical protein